MSPRGQVQLMGSLQDNVIYDNYTTSSIGDAGFSYVEFVRYHTNYLYLYVSLHMFLPYHIITISIYHIMRYRRIIIVVTMLNHF